MPPLSLSEEATLLLQNSYWRGNIRQLKNLAEQMAVIEMDHQISAETLRKYLPQEENRQEIVLRTPTQQAGKDYSHEIGILYNMIMKNRQELDELKEMISARHDVIPATMREDLPQTITFAPTETTTRKPIEAEDIESSLRVDEGEKERIIKALELSGGNRKVAAQKVGLSERTLYRKIKEYGLG